MATLIQSKQIEGIVTASVVEGVFQVSGSQIITGSQELSGDITASNIRVTGNYYGDGSQLTFGGTGLVSGSSQVSISLTSGYSTFSSSLDSRLVSLENATDSTGSDSQTLSISGDQLTIAGGNTVTIPTGSGVSSYTDLINVPSSIVSSSAQITALGFVSESGDSTPAGTVSSSAQITALGFISSSTDAQTLSLNQVTRILSISNGNSVDLTPVVGGASDISGSIWSTGSNWYYVSADLKVTGSFHATSLTGSIDYSNLTNVPTLVSGSGQITSLGFISESTDITSLNSYTSSTDGRLTNIEAATGSYLTSSGSVDFTDITSVPGGLVSGSAQITALGFVSESGDSTPAGTISGSAQITALGFISSSHTDITSLNTFTSSIQTEVDGLSSATSSYLTSSGSVDYTDLTSVPSGILSGSAQITSLGFVSESSSVPAGTISGSAQITSLGFISSSHTDITSLNSFTSSIQTEVDGISSQTSSYLTSSGSVDFTDITSVPSGLVSGSSQLTSSYDTRYALSGSGGGATNISSLNTFTSSIQTEVDGLSAATSSYLTSLDSGIVSSSAQITALGFVSESGDSTPAGTISGSAQITALGFISESTTLPSGLISGSSQLTSSYDVRYQLSGSSIPFDGNRIVSQEKLPTMFTSSFNPGTSGSVVDFLNAIFYPNTQPSITSGNQTIAEFSGSGASIFTIEATDPEGQSLTFGTSSDYTDDLVRVSSAGVVTLNANATSASFNTDLVGGSHGHTFVARVEDTFGAEVTKDITIFVTPNAAPQFRETSIAGNVITNVTSNLNENSADGTLVKRVFFTDAEGDTITIDSSSILPAGGSTHFTITKYSNYIDIEQNTGSLDYETYPVYTFSLSASDEHYQNSDDSDSIVTLPVSISVVDNVHPTINNQTLSSINENSSNGATVGTISATDSEGDAITFSQFTLYKLELDDSNVASGSYGGTSQATDPHENPFQMNSSGQVTRKTGVFLNSDLINEYQYTVRVRDSFNTASNEAIVTIPIDDDTPATLTDNWSAGPYIKESENSGSTIRTTDYGSTVADYGSNQSGTFSSSNPSIAIASNGNLSLAVDLSGSATSSGDTIDSTITFTNTFGTTTTDALSVNVIANVAPTISFTNQTANFNTNLGTSGSTMVSMSVSDTESDTPFSASLSGSDLELVYSNADSSSIGLHLTTDSTAREYFYSVTITDQFGKSRTYSDRSFTVAQADTGTLGGDTTSYIIESAVSGALIRESSNGRTGNQAQLTVSYSPSYGSPSVASFTSSLDETIAINSSGQLSLLVDLSGSATSSGDTITPTITFQDQYGNLGSGSITINVAANQAPSATFTNQSANFETNLALSGSTMVSMSISDDESDTPFSASISGSNLELVYSSADSSSVGIHATSNLTARTHTYSVTVFDQFGKSRTYTDRTFTVSQSADYGQVYVYDVGYDNSGNNYNLALGIQSEDGSTPPVATPYADSGFLDSIINDNTLSLGTFNYSYGSLRTATSLASGSGANLHDVLRGMGSSGNITRSGTNAFVIIFPSGSDMGGIPTSTTDSYGGSNVGRYVLEVGADATTIDGSNTLESSEINQYDLATSHLGYTTWFMVGPANGVSSTSTINLGLNAESGSGGV